MNCSTLNILFFRFVLNIISVVVAVEVVEVLVVDSVAVIVEVAFERITNVLMTVVIVGTIVNVVVDIISVFDLLNATIRPTIIAIIRRVINVPTITYTQQREQRFLLRQIT